MPKFLVQATYTSGGIQGLLKEGGTKRKEAVEAAVRGLGGTVEALYFAYGDQDIFVIVDMPSNEAAIAAALTSSASGVVNAKLTVLIMPEEIDAAAKLSVDYRPPGE